ncbi:MAG: tetratricopeptide repeat protein [Thermoanaerobaculia bacterium]
MVSFILLISQLASVAATSGPLVTDVTEEAAYYYAIGDLDGAILALKCGLEGTPDKPQLHFMLANALYRKQEFNLAVLHYEEAARLRPRHVDTHLNLGYARFHMGAVDEALEAWQTTARATPGDALVHLSLAIGYAAKQQLPRAHIHLRRAAFLDTDWSRRLSIDIRWTREMLETIGQLARASGEGQGRVPSTRNVPK